MKKSSIKNQGSFAVRVAIPLSIKAKLENQANKNCRTLSNEILYIVLEKMTSAEKAKEDLVNFLNKAFDKRKSKISKVSKTI